MAVLPEASGSKGESSKPTARNQGAEEALVSAGARMDTSGSYARTWIENVAARGPVCAWCRHPEKPVHRAGLCAHCYRIQRQVARLDSACKGRGRTGSRRASQLEIRIARQMMTLAKGEGEAYSDLSANRIDGLKLEHELSFLSRRFLRKDLYRGLATPLEWSFPPDQRVLLYYLIALMNREYLRRDRRKIAESRVLLGRDEPECGDLRSSTPDNSRR